MVISTKMIYLILIFSLPILPPVLVQSALLFPFLNYIIKLYCFQYTSYIFIIRNILFIFLVNYLLIFSLISIQKIFLSIHSRHIFFNVSNYQRRTASGFGCRLLDSIFINSFSLLVLKDFPKLQKKN